MKSILHKYYLFIIGIALFCMHAQSHAGLPQKFHPGHYMSVYVNGPNSHKILAETAAHPNIIGVQKPYRWDELEPRKGVYDFSEIAADLKFLKSINKRLVIQVQDVWTIPVVPNYLRTPEYGGGYYKGSRSCCYSAKRWHPKVVARLSALFHALGDRFDKDSFVEAINIEETATGITKAEFARAGYTAEKYLSGSKAIMLAAKAAFPNTLFIQYINYIAGNGGSYVGELAAHASRIGVGIGGPGTRPSVDVDSYPYYEQYDSTARQGVRIEVFNHDDIDPATGAKYTPRQLLNFARNQLHVEYVFWHRAQPRWDNTILPVIDRYR